MTIRELAYLRTPDRIRAALINTVGHAPPLAVIERELSAILQPRPDGYGDVGEPTEGDGLYYAPRRNPHYVAAGHTTLAANFKASRPAEKPRVYKTPPNYSPTVASERLVEQVCEMMGLDPARMMGPTRVRVYVYARAIVAKLLKERNPSVYSCPRIAACIGRKDHSTVLNLLSQFETYLRVPIVRETYEALSNPKEKRNGY
jgi:hypothetical protein